MKILRYIIILSFIGISIELFAQRIDKDSIDSMIKLYYPTSNNIINRLYIIDGIPVDSDKIDSLIEKNNIRIAKLAFLDFKKAKSIIWDRQTDVVIIVSESSYNNKYKRKDYKAATKLVKRASNDLHMIPVLLLDSKQIDNNKALLTIKGLSLNQIKTINIFEDSVSIDKFGFNGKNGLIEIKTKK
jgi:hypothetical protein